MYLPQSATQSEEAQSLLEATHALLPLVASYGDQIESERRLPQPLVEAIAQAGVYKMLVPKTLGGSEADPETFCLVLEELGRADGSTGWTSLLAAMFGASVPFFSDDVAWEIFGKDANVCCAGSLAPAANPSQRPPDRAVAVDGGYRVTSRWSFTSGCMHSTWLIGQVAVYDGDVARLDSNGQSVKRNFFFPVSHCQIIDIWNTTGLRGTGSNDFAVTDCFVTDAYSLPTNRELQILRPGTLYTFTAGPAASYSAPWLHMGTIGTAAVCLGIARGALDALLELAATKTARGGSGKLINSPIFHDQIGRAEATLGAARAYIYHTAHELWQYVQTTGGCHSNHGAALRLAGTHAAILAAEVVDMVWTAAGASGIFVGNPIERRFRDIHTTTQNVVIQPSRYGEVGKAILGVE